MLQQTRRLSSAPGTGFRVIGAIFGLLFVVGGALLGFFALASQLALELLGVAEPCVDPASLDLPPGVVPEGVDINFCGGWVPEHIGPFQLVLMVVGVGLMLFGGYFALLAVRTAAWLSGTVLRVRGALRSRTVDLATAEVTMGTITHANGHHTVRTVKLIARDPATGRQLALALRGASTDLLPPPELRALADAMTVGRPESDADVWRASAQLRELADNPLSLPQH